MLQCSGHIAERESARAMLAQATERFLASGNGIQTIASGVSGEPKDGKKLARAFRINDPDKPKAEPRRKAERTPRLPNEPKRGPMSKRESIRQATDKRCAKHREKRVEMSVKVTFYAGLGFTLKETADELSVTRHLIRRIANEHNIKFRDGRKAQ